jgi:hypothetical protein
MSNKEPYSIKNLKKSLENIKYEEVKPLIASQSTYTYSYEKIKKHFEELKKKKDYSEWLVIGSSIVYSWMPTILNIGGRDSNKNKKKSSEEQRTRNDIPSIEKEARISLKKINGNKDNSSGADELQKIQLFINNSVVGMSKFLHFSFPEKYPIWDSRVESFLYATANNGKPTKSNYHRLKVLNNYLKYTESCLRLIDKKEDFMKYFDEYEELKDLKPLRKIEFLLFLKGE